MQPSSHVPSSSRGLRVNRSPAQPPCPPSKRRRTTSASFNQNSNSKSVSFPTPLAEHASTVPSPSPSASADRAWSQEPSLSCSRSRSRSRSQSQSLSHSHSHYHSQHRSASPSASADGHAHAHVNSNVDPDPDADVSSNPSANAPASPSRSRPCARPQLPARSPSPCLSRSASPSDSRTVSSQQPTPTTAKWFRKPSVVWYRGHDLRVEDHPALLAAAQRGGPVIPFFVWDPSDGFGANLGAVKQWWLRESLRYLQRDLHRLGVKLYTRTGSSMDELRSFLADTGADAVFWNRCYEPDLLKRDEELRVELSQEGFTAESFKAELLVEPWELSKSDTSPCYDTFHAYMRAWMTVPPPPHPFPSPSRLKSISAAIASVGIDSLGLRATPQLERELADRWTPGSAQAKLQLDKFLCEVFPAFGEGRCRRHADGTSQLSPHIRFGELSPRRMYHSTRLQVSRWDQSTMYNPTPPTASKSAPAGQPKDAAFFAADRASFPTDAQVGNLSRGVRIGSVAGSIALVQHQNADEALTSRDEEGNQVLLSSQDASAELYHQRQALRKRGVPHISLSARAFLKNLCLRDFAYHVLFHNPNCNSDPLVREFASFPWAEDNGSFNRWCEGTTGYPIVDAAMRELRQTGWVHNGMRFLLACFLTKQLLLPWSRGLKKFYGLLLDGDRSSNALGWQWTAGSNTDAFPVGMLVNPIKVAYRYDPTGSYVRRWVPELAKLPNEFVHEPWKAPTSTLKNASVDIGSTYPKRVILMSEARSRLQNAMVAMKQIFSGSSVWRSLPGRPDPEVKEWPVDQPEELRLDDSSISAKINLLPSLWALLERDSSSSYLAGSSSGTDPLIAIDTASLVEGALAVPIDEHHESIEHALITAHEQGDSHQHFSSIGEEHMSMHSPHLTSAYITDGGDCAVPDLRSIGVDVADGNAGRDVYGKTDGNVDVGAFGDLDRERRSAGGLQGVRKSLEDGLPDRGGAAINSVVSSSAHMPHLTTPQPTLSNAHTSGGFGAFGMPPPVAGGFGLAGTHASVPLSSTFPMGAQVTPVSGIAPLSRGSPPPVAPVPHAHMDYRRASVDGVGGGPHMGIAGTRAVGATPDAGVYMGGVGTAGNLGVSLGLVNGGRVSASGVAGSAADVGGAAAGGATFGGDPNGALYAPHLNLGQFYGFPHVVPMVGPHGGERGDLIGAGAPPGAKFPAIPGLIPMGYGMYGGGVVDGGLVGGNAFGAAGSTYGTHGGAPGIAPLAGGVAGGVPSSSQQAAHHMSMAAAAAAAVGYGMSASPSMYVHGGGVGAAGVGAAGVGAAGVCAAGVGNTEAVGSAKPNLAVDGGNVGEVGISQQTTPLNGIDSGGSSAAIIDAAAHQHGHERNQVAAAAAVAATAAAVIHVSSLPMAAARSRNFCKASSDDGRRRRLRSNGGTGGNRRNNNNNNHNNNNNNIASASGTGSGNVSGSGGGNGISVRTTSKVTKTSAKTTARRKKKGQEGEGGDKKGGTAEGDEETSTCLKAREELLVSMLTKTDDEYNLFAKYLNEYYELTANTDRQVSKDYVRLCKLKDDYHKRCDSEKDKLKIYRIKAFFSKVLNLPVTGEWDRHNHGGVRGPYVYGIRLRKQQPQPQQQQQQEHEQQSSSSAPP